MIDCILYYSLYNTVYCSFVSKKFQFHVDFESLFFRLFRKKMKKFAGISLILSILHLAVAEMGKIYVLYVFAFSVIKECFCFFMQKFEIELNLNRKKSNMKSWSEVGR